jgi:hypothetical protein
MASPFMETIAREILKAATSIRVVRFNFPYMTRAHRENRRRPPDREAVLLTVFREMAARYDAASLYIGGKSMGGRMASQVADELGVAGLVCLGYPFHPPGRPDKLRTDHLNTLDTPTLICQGTRDTFGELTEVSGYRLAESIRFHWLEDGDHSFKPRKASGRTLEQNLGEAAAEVAAFLLRKH